ncbi:MAG: DedA family protein [Bdellovibrionales bacterium]|nr:DedA family protein [Bdellovibrionales bacterium]
MLEHILAADGWHLYAALFLALMGGAIGLPIPEDLPLIGAGIVAQAGEARIDALFVVSYVSIILGDLVIFSLGRRFGSALFSKPWFHKKLPPRKLKRFRLNLEKRSLPTIFIARHLFYLRTVTFLTCGAVKMKYSRFLFADSIAALVSVPLMMSIGYFFAEHSETLAKNIRLFLLVLIPITLLFVFIRYRKKKNRMAAKGVPVAEVVPLKSSGNEPPHSPTSSPTRMEK